MPDLRDAAREWLEDETGHIVQTLYEGCESLAIAREAMIAAFDQAAAEIDNEVL